MKRATYFCSLAAYGLLAACGRSAQKPSTDAGESPQASAEPAPVVTMLPSLPTSSAGGWMSALPTRGDQAFPPDRASDITPRETLRDAGAKFQADAASFGRDTPFLVGSIRIKPLEAPSVIRHPEFSASVIEGARKRLDLRFDIVMSLHRLRVVLASPGFAWPWGTELRARSDRTGHLVFIPEESGRAERYYVAPMGSLRAWFGERRFDLAPLSPMSVADNGDGPKRLGFRTHRITATTRAGTATLDVANVHGSGGGGGLLARFFLDWLSAAPSSAIGRADDVPLAAEFHWPTGGGILFEMESLDRRAEIAVSALLTPPEETRFDSVAPQVPPAQVFLTRNELEGWRERPIDVPATKSDAAPPPPAQGLVLVNASSQLRVAWLDGVPAAWLSPGARAYLLELPRGKYSLEWRTYLGDIRSTPETVVVPGTSEVTEASVESAQRR